MSVHVPQPGDIGFACMKATLFPPSGEMGALIRLGTWLKFHKATFNHEFAVDRVVDGVPYVIQATIHGVTDTARLDEVAPGGLYVLLPPPASVDVEKFLFFCRQQVGVKYGILTIVAMAIDVVSWQWVPSFRGARKNSLICTALVNEGLRFGGWYHDWVDIYNIFPDEGYDALVAEGSLVHVYDATEWPYYVNLPKGPT
jgi:hypothetical protein